MIGLIIVSHGNLGQEFISVLEHIAGEQEQIAAVSVTAEDDVAKKRDEILSSIEKVDSGKGVLLLTDMFGGTPSNLAISVTQDKKIEVLAGVNLPMLVRVASNRQTEDLVQLALSGQEAGRKYINAASAVLQS